MRALLVIALLGGIGCGAERDARLRSSAPGGRAGSSQGKAGAAASGKAAAPRTACDYHVSAPAEPPYVVHVTARCEGGGVNGFASTEARAVPFVTATPTTEPTAIHAATRVAPGVAELTYTVDLDGLAQREDDIDVARRFGSSLVAPASSFLLRPSPEQDDVPITVHFDSPAIESGLRRSGDAYTILSHELRVATFTTFGAREARDLSIPGASVRLVLLDGRLDLTADELARWVTTAARGVADFFQRPPASRTLVVLGPLSGRHGIPFGKMLPATAPGVIVLLGEHTAPRELTEDWVLVHELFHAGTPSFVGEGKWYDEGLATYFEPLIRARLGWRSEAEVWREFVTNMPRGLEAMTRRGLEHPGRYPDMYWGGGLFCLLADVRARTLSGGLVGLEDGLRAVLAEGGAASEVWSLARVTEVTDRALYAPILSELEAAHLTAGSPVDLPALFHSLGVTVDRKGELHFDDEPSLLALRHDLVYGPPLVGPVKGGAAH